ncbi:MAG TPA: hypothetical protein VE172_04130 [Stackebrandtia sp.]|jgi:hypothetical protein|uniref:hypothetical protein n=1 Tax=Stackebrandtia sp. TaxID=2023065 RepID=UPI002D466518|nr:hypothetical protein [Stackebrandtia sp.]HZE37979.1 hypothetical protein [Stackebrandtia sp.]
MRTEGNDPEGVPATSRRGWWVTGAALVLVVAVSAGVLFGTGHLAVTFGPTSKPSDVGSDQSGTASEATHRPFHNDSQPVDCATGSFHAATVPKGFDPVAISPNGKYIVGEVDKPAKSFGLWHNGKLSIIEGYPQSEEGVLDDLDVNDSGEVAGSGSPAWRYADGRFQSLKNLDEGTAFIANDGSVTGEVDVSKPEGTAPARWAPGETKPTRLRGPEDPNVEIAGVSVSGTAVGVAYETNSDGTPKVWAWDASGNPKQFTDYHEYAYPLAVSGDWALLTTSSDRSYVSDYDMDEQKLRLNLDTGKIEKVDGIHEFGSETQGAALIDSCGRAYALDDANNFAVADPSKVEVLPGSTKPQDQGLEEDNPSNVFVDVSADGSIALGASWDGGLKMWVRQ